ncbi:MAG: glycogen synthase GlgA [Candidatus Hodarchaeales archaeon]|jgi:starch synthase
MRIAMFASEMVPYIKTGGLADVIGSLPHALAKKIDGIDVFIPYYREIKKQSLPTTKLEVEFQLKIGSRNFKGYSYELKTRNPKFTVYFIDNYQLFGIRSSLYVKNGRDYRDNLSRFVFLCRGSLETVKFLSNSKDYDIFHLHDWQTALISLYTRIDPFFVQNPPRILFTIHNLAYQGLFPISQFKLLGIGNKYKNSDYLEYWGKINLMKAGLIFSDKITTVSPTYAEEIQTKQYGAGLEKLLKKNSQKLTGILNGVDYSTWNPETDPFISQNFSSSNLKGKNVCKSSLQSSFQLVEDLSIPLFCVVSRLVWQKGMDLILGVLPELMSSDIQLILLGTGDVALENQFRDLGNHFPEKIGVSLTYNEQLAHQIEAGADIFLMPSRYEPCGLNDKYSLRYGTVPIVFKTGGLVDSVIDVSNHPSHGTGFIFEKFEEKSFKDSIIRALKLFQRKQNWVELMQRGMEQDFSWDKAAAKYLDLYQR